MRSHHFTTFLVSLCGAAILAVAPSARAASDRLVLTGASTVAPLAAEMGKRFEKQNPGVRVDVQTGGSSRGVNDARNGMADIGMASRSLNKDEQDLRSHTIAMDGVGVILHRSNLVQTLSNAQIVGIYTGKIINWKEVGGADARITVVNKAERRSTLELFLHHFQLKSSDIKAQVVIGDNQQGVKTVVGNPGAIGYVSIGTAEYAANHGTAIRLLSMDGVAATVENVRAARFPLARPLNLVTRGAPSALAKGYIDFARSQAMHDLVAAQDFVPVAR